MDGWGRIRTATAAPAISAQPRSTLRREPASATASGPRNSSVTASPRPIRSIAVYSDRFMVANTSASDSTGHHCRQVNERSRGRPTASSATPATHCRTATTPAGPITGNASAPTAAPTWLDRPLPSIMATPAERPERPAEPSGGGAPDGRRWSREIAMPRVCGRRIHTQNACMALAIR